jgi:hypothetical protein
MAMILLLDVLAGQAAVLASALRVEGLDVLHTTNSWFACWTNGEAWGSGHTSSKQAPHVDGTSERSPPA